MSDQTYSQDYSLLVSIVKESYATDVIKAAQQEGAHGATIVLGKGLLTQAQANFFGRPLETGRHVIFLAVRSDRKKQIMQHVYNNTGLKTDAHGLIFELPLIGAAGIAPINVLDSKFGDMEGRQ